VGDPVAADPVVEVLPDVSGIDRAFHYSVPRGLKAAAVPGTIVRIWLHGRRIRGWVVSTGTPLPPGVEAVAISDVVSQGPSPEVVDLCRWAAWRYAGRLRPLLMAASPLTIVRLESALNAGGGGGEVALGGETTRRRPGEAASPYLSSAIDEALGAKDAVLRLPPAVERLPVVLAVLEKVGRTPHGHPFILVESHRDAETLAGLLEARGWPAALYPNDWALAGASGRVVIGTRNVVLAPGRCSVLLVLDAHSEAYRSERVPTFDARVIAAERARREGVPVCFVTPCPSLELVADRAIVRLERAAERAGWPKIAVLDVREEDPRAGGYSSRLVSIVRGAVAEAAGEVTPGGRLRPVVLVLNRTGRARLLACGGCRNIQRCDSCGSALVQTVKPPKGETGTLTCPRCAVQTEAICPACGSARLRILRPGVSRAREQLEGVLGIEVAEFKPGVMPPAAPVLVGTEAVLHGVRRAAMVGWLDFDQELLAPRFRAAEQALVGLARSARLVGDRSGPARVFVRTSLPDHEVLRAAELGNPDVLAEAESLRRAAFRLPPYSALASVGGQAAATAVEGLSGVETSLQSDGDYLVRAPDEDGLANAFASLVEGEVSGWAGIDARIEVDPIRV